MKKQILLFIIFISAICSETFAQCQANFTWMQTSSNVISFTNTSTGTTPNTNYSWTFGDAGYSAMQNPFHTYNVPGTYNVCLTIIDSMGNCNSTFCGNITVTGNLICNIILSTTATVTSCGTCTDGSATAFAYNGTAPYSYNWQTVPVQNTAIATGLAAGTYTCCVADANGCTACNTATVNVTSCQAAFTWTQTANNTISFTNTSTGAPSFTTYHWTFGDANQNFSQNPTHYYVAPGTYVVCLELTDSSAFCSSTFCDTITVTGINCNNLAVTLAVTDASCPSCGDGSAIASATGGTPPYAYLWSNSSTSPMNVNLFPGYYTVIVTDAINCTVTATALVDSSAGCSSFFTLSYVSPQVYSGVNFSNGTPSLTYQWSWGDNTSSNTAYPTHTYASPGFYTICLSIADAMGCVSTYCDSFNIVRMTTPFSVISVTINPPGPSGINNAEPQNYCSVFPNPASDHLFIDYSLASSANTRIILYDVLGNILRIFNDDMAQGKHGLTFDISTLRQGFYVLSLQSKNYSVARPVVVVK